jgi:hypothetical protein
MTSIFIPSVAIVAVLFVVLVLVLISIWHENELRRRFPAISEREFIARCKAGTNPRVALKVRRIVADNLGVKYDRIYPSTRFAEDIGAD